MPRSLLRLPGWPFQAGALVVLSCAFLVCGSPVHAETAYVVVTPSASAPAGTTQSFLALTTTYFNATVVTNPLFPGTYQVLLLSAKPGVPVSPVNLTSTGTYIVKIGTDIKTVFQSTEPINDIYAYGWRDGAEVVNQEILNLFYGQMAASNNYSSNCANPIFWGLLAIDPTTCERVLGKAYADIQDIYFSSHTVPSPFGQGN